MSVRNTSGRTPVNNVQAAAMEELLRGHQFVSNVQPSMQFPFAVQQPFSPLPIFNDVNALPTTSQESYSLSRSNNDAAMWMTPSQQSSASTSIFDDANMWFSPLQQPCSGAPNVDYSTMPMTPFPELFPAVTNQCVCSESAKEIEELKRQVEFLRARCEFLEKENYQYRQTEQQTHQSRKRAAEDVPEGPVAKMSVETLLEQSEVYSTREILTSRKLPTDFNDDTVIAEVHLKDLKIKRVRGSVTDSPKVYAGDLKRFREGMWANDNIIDYSLFQFMYQHWHPTQFETTHVFNSLFVASLRRNFTKEDLACSRFSEDSPVIGTLHENVERMLKYQVDVFKKEMLVVPACLSDHWLFAIVLNPRNALIPGKTCSIAIFNSIAKDKKNNRHLTALIREYLCATFEKTKKVGGKYFEAETQEFYPGQVVPFLVKGQPVQTNLDDCGFYLLQNFKDFFTKEGFDPSHEGMEKTDWSKVAPQAANEAQQMRGYILKCILGNYDQEDKERLGFA